MPEATRIKQAIAGSISNPEVSKSHWCCWAGLLLFVVSACVAANWLTRDRSDEKPAHRTFVTRVTDRVTGPALVIAVRRIPQSRTLVFGLSSLQKQSRNGAQAMSRCPDKVCVFTSPQERVYEVDKLVF